MNAKDETKKTCCFFGHRSLYHEEDLLLLKLVEQIELLIKDGFNEFLFGGYGHFDALAHRAVKKLKRIYKHIRTVYVQAYYKPFDKETTAYLKTQYDEITYPPIEDKPLKYAIVYRNYHMIDISDYCIFYVYREYGGAKKAMRYAVHKHKNHQNLIDSQSNS